MKIQIFYTRYHSRCKNQLKHIFHNGTSEQPFLIAKKLKMQLFAVKVTWIDIIRIVY